MHPDFLDEVIDEDRPRIITDEERTRQHWIDHGMDFVSQKLNTLHNTKKAKNVILFIGDGMSHATVKNENS